MTPEDWDDLQQKRHRLMAAWTVWQEAYDAFMQTVDALIAAEEAEATRPVTRKGGARSDG